MAGLSTSKARTRIVELFERDRRSARRSRQFTHHVKFYEKGDRPLEIITSRQWRHQDDGAASARRVARGRELHWYPAHMVARYENGERPSTGDWCVSRAALLRRAVPRWYGVTADGTPDRSRRLLPDESRLPIDPSHRRAGRLSP